MISWNRRRIVWLIAGIVAVGFTGLACSSASSSTRGNDEDGGQDANVCACTVNGVTFACGASSCVNSTKYSCDRSQVTKTDACGMVPCPRATNGPQPDVCAGDTQYCIEIAKLVLEPDGGTETNVLESGCAPRPSGCADCTCIGDVTAAWTALGKSSGDCSGQTECATDSVVVTQICFK